MVTGFVKLIFIVESFAQFILNHSLSLTYFDFPCVCCEVYAISRSISFSTIPGLSCLICLRRHSVYLNSLICNYISLSRRLLHLKHATALKFLSFVSWKICTFLLLSFFSVSLIIFCLFFSILTSCLFILLCAFSFVQRQC